MGRSTRISNRIIKACAALMFLLCCAETAIVQAQSIGGPRRVASPRRITWSYYDPSYEVTSRIYAQADLIRAQAEAAADYARAREIRAEAADRELENWEKANRIKWEVRILKEKKQLELNFAKQVAKMKRLNDEKWENTRTWEKLKNHPELSGYNIENGTAHNFLLARLSLSPLIYEYDPEESPYGPESLPQFILDPELLEHLTLEQGGYEFAADEEVQEEIKQWPFLLRWDEFEEARSAFEAARVQAVRESRSEGEVSVESIERLRDAQQTLFTEFYHSPKVWDWAKANRRYTQREAGIRFLVQLDREIDRLEETGDIRPFQGRSGYDPAIHGKHVISLLTFMNRNGIEFAPAKPGSEFAYENLFVMMRAVYLTVAEQDASIQPENLGERIEADE